MKREKTYNSRHCKLIYEIYSYDCGRYEVHGLMGCDAV
jgi:hypothetical protein